MCHLTSVGTGPPYFLSLRPGTGRPTVPWSSAEQSLTPAGPVVRGCDVLAPVSPLRSPGVCCNMSFSAIHHANGTHELVVLSFPQTYASAIFDVTLLKFEKCENDTLQIFLKHRSHSLEHVHEYTVYTDNNNKIQHFYRQTEPYSQSDLHGVVGHLFLELFKYIHLDQISYNLTYNIYL